MPHKRAKRSVREKTRAESGMDLVPGVRKSIENEEIPKGAARVLNAAKVQQEFAERKRKQRGEADDGHAAGPSRKKQKGAGKGEGASALRIQPGESIGHFNRRVEDSLRHTVKEAMQSSSAKMRQTRKEEDEERAQKKAANKAAAISKAAAKSHKTSGDDSASDPDSDDEGGARAVPLRRTGAKDSGKTKDNEKMKDSGKPKDHGKPKEFERVSSSAPKRLNDIVQAPPQIKQLPRKAKKLAAAAGGERKAGSGISLKDGVLSMAQKAMMEEERERVIRLYREMKRRKGST